MAKNSEDSTAGEQAALEKALAETPRGTLALAGTAMALLLLAWLAIYFFVFLPRGPVS